MSTWTLKAESVKEQRMAHEPDLAEIRLAVQTFADAEANLFIQSLPSRKFAVLAGHDLDGVCQAATEWNDGRSFFFGVNPCRLLSEAPKDADILRRRWLFIDIDRNKQLQPDDPATDQEHEDAKELAHEILTYLSATGFPAPVQVDSGNGFHLYYRIDMANDAASKAIVRDVLGILDNTFSDARGDVGAECHDARRLSRMPGTWSRRGSASKTRPYRMAKFLHVPKVIELAPVELLAKLADRQTPINGVGSVAAIIPEPEKKNAFVLSAGSPSEERKKAYAKSAIDAECGKVALAPQGQRNSQLFKSAAALYELVAGELLTDLDVKDALFIAAVRAGLDKDPNCGEKGILTTIASGKKHGEKNPRQLPAAKEETPAWTLKTGCNGTPIVPTALYTLPELLALQIPDHQWAVPGILSEGLTLLAGAPKQGKSWLALNLAITIAAGGHALGDTKVAPGDVLYLCLEDRLRRVQYRSKKILAGLSYEASSRLKIAVEWPRMDQGGMDRIAEWARNVPNPTLCIIDVWQKFKPVSFNGKSKNQYEEDYQYSTMLKGFADGIGASVVAIHHTKKSKSEDWLEDVSGTLGLAGAADGVLVLQRVRGEWEAKLCMTGRDIDEKELALRFNPETAVWTSEGSEADRARSKTQNAIMDVMRLHPGAMYTSSEMAGVTGIDSNTVRQTMLRMAEKGIIEKVKSQYRYPVEGRTREEEF